MTATISASSAMVESFRQAVSHHQAGRLAEAESAYRDLLSSWPGHPGASHNLGLLLLGKGLREEGLALLSAAFDGDRQVVQYGLSYLDALLHFGDVVRAAAVLAEARALGVDASALTPRADRLQQLQSPTPLWPTAEETQRLVELFNAGQHGALEAHARTLTECYPGFATGWKALGLALHALERHDEAAEALRRCTELSPDDAEAHNNLGAVLQAGRHFPEAEACFRRALILQPGFAGAQRNLAVALRDQGRHAEAETCLRSLLQAYPGDALLHSNLGLLFAVQGRMPEAEVCYRKALEIKPDFAECIAQLADVHRELGRLTEAESGFNRALALDPALPAAFEGLANLALASGQPGRAVEAYSRAIELAPNRLTAHSSLLFALNYASGAYSVEALTIASAYGERLATQVRQRYAAWLCTAQPARLRVGFVSGDLRQHPVGFFLEGILPLLDRDRFELIAFPTVDTSDLLTEQLRASFAAWCPITRLSDDEAAAQIHAYGVHLLIDLSGHTAHQRLGVFARRPAPVQLSWPGYFATTGVAEIDWFLADEVTVPPESRRYFVEQVWYLPETRLCFTPPIDAPAVSPLPMSSRPGPTLGCFQNLNKVTDDVLRLWARVLQALPAARLRLQSHQLREAEGVERIRVRLSSCGIDLDRVSLHPATSRLAYLAAHAEVDFILDTFPYTGGTTSCEALWMGVPTLTLRGETLIARQGASIMQAAGLSAWVADNPDDYVARAVRLAADHIALAHLRAGMRARLVQCALFDTPRFTRQLEDALWGMWREAGSIARVPGCEPPVLESLQDATPSERDDHYDTQQLVELFKADKHEALVAHARALTQRQPGHGLAWKVMGVALRTLGRLDEALAAMEQAVERLPEDVEARGNLGLVLFDLGRHAQAAECQRQALALDPADPDSIVNLVAALFAQGQLDEALQVLQDGDQRIPRNFQINLRLAEVFWRQNRLSEAETHLKMASELSLNDPEAHFKLGTLLYEQRRHGEAERVLRYVLTLKPDHARAHGNLGLIQQVQHRYEAAEQHFRDALALEPELAALHSNLGSALLKQGRLIEALACFRQALVLRPDWAVVHSNILFTLNYVAEDSPQTLLEEAKAFGCRIAVPEARRHADWRVQAEPARLRVGFVSGDLCQHPVGYFLEGILPALDRSRLELIAYPTGDRSDVLTEQLKASFSAWHPLNELDDDAAAARIRDDGVHVLIDLSGHTALNRLEVFARKPAPVQVSWPGYFATTGVAEMDWFIADRVTVPETHQGYFTERIWYLPDTRLCFTPPVDAPPVAPLPMLRKGAPVLGCFQNLTKVSDAVLRLWARVLDAVPQATLRFQALQLSEPAGQAKLHDRLLACGIEPSRVEMHPSSSRRDYLAAHAEVDLILDTFPFTGGTTTCEALWMGVPTLTLAGDTLIARQGASIMQAAGLSDWVLESHDAYVERAVALLAAPAELASLRSGLRERLLRTALFDTPRFARHLEEVLWGMWRHFTFSEIKE